MSLTIIRKFGISASGKRMVSFLLFCFCAILLLAVCLFFTSLPKIIEYGFNDVTSNTRLEFIFSILLYIILLLTYKELRIYKGRYICVCKERIYGEAGDGSKSQPVDLAIDDIISASGHPNGTVIIYSVKGDYRFNYIENSVVCATMINNLIKERFVQQINESKETIQHHPN